MQYKGTMDAIQKIYGQEGAKSFYKGALSNIIRNTGGALVLVIDTEIKAHLFGGKSKFAK